MDEYNNVAVKLEASTWPSIRARNVMSAIEVNNPAAEANKALGNIFAKVVESFSV